MQFINTTQHNLTTEQVAAISNFMSEQEKYFDGTIYNLKDIEPELFNRLANTPDNDDEMSKLVVEFATYINNYWNGVFHLPIGSPAFMFKLASFLQWRFVSSKGEKTYYICMSHTKRVSIEKDGVKTSVFQFERFIRVE